MNLVTIRDTFLTNMGFKEAIALTLNETQDVLFADSFSKIFWVSRLDKGRHANFDCHFVDVDQIPATIEKLIDAGWDKRPE
jgi:hypothetical protein